MTSVADYEVRLCDFCNESKALLYCRADSAKLCLNCDREVHSTNQLFSKHSRCLLCDSCDSSPASIFCCSESVVLCQNCDWETHKEVRSIHDRRLLEGFNGCPTVSELLNFLGFDDLEKKSLVLGDGGNDDGWSDLLVWETPSIVSIDDLIVSNDSSDSGRSFQAMGVPPLPKNRNVTCGKYKEEILCQLREMAKTEPNYSSCLEYVDSHVEFIRQAPEKFQLMDNYNSPCMDNNTAPTVVPSYETSAHERCDSGVIRDQVFHTPVLNNLIEINHLVPDKDSDCGDNLGSASSCLEMQSQVLADPKVIQVISAGGMRELNTQERDSAISRYKEKRKTRRYDKQIRYESRKVRAEGRTRVKGRFAKMDH
ncbi:zinc finger protein CONSTANS-LIKE 13-like [Dorcoceras hygrometricum]|uniref:Zinc finger protein CONSTANS-LIKE 13-like n=1 Tax=Dorcoceras hygrometricum TaxID=472368 RepID=A0A2Z7CEX7_9LAMI|nr:zinc finger protein CONSTANS-LIKE 13-like [Dorcoceras hygrometricum]